VRRDSRLCLAASRPDPPADHPESAISIL